MIKTRVAMARDISTITNLDLKSQDYPTESIEVLKKYVEDPERVAFLSTIGNRDVGYALCYRPTRMGDDCFAVVRLGVHPDFRNMGVARRLVSTLSLRAAKLKCDVIQMYVPSYKIDDPGDPDYIGWWFDSIGLKAAGCNNRFYFRYGEWWDAYKFEASI